MRTGRRNAVRPAHLVDRKADSLRRLAVRREPQRRVARPTSARIIMSRGRSSPTVHRRPLEGTQQPCTTALDAATVRSDAFFAREAIFRFAYATVGLKMRFLARSKISHYRIIRQLGSGGMGEVFLAEDTTLGRKVAIKMLPERSVGSDLARQRLINEAKAAAALDHPNICAIHEVGEEDDCVFIVMQYIDGESLAERIGQHALAPADVVDIGIQAAQALEAAHAAGVIHRDIKPQNIIVTPRGQLKVLDFGLAKLAAHDLAVTQTRERLTVAGTLLGTPAFMSPEQLRGLDIDARSDIYSLGSHPLRMRDRPICVRWNERWWKSRCR